ncbi:MAG: DUF1365 family protein, partial [Pseudomonadota bacterium]
MALTQEQALEPQILFGKVMHKRFFPRENGFQYGIYYLGLPLAKIAQSLIKKDCFSLLSFYKKDHAAR